MLPGRIPSARRLLGRYDYPIRHRALEVVSLGCFAGYALVFVGRLAGAVVDRVALSFAMAALAVAVLAYLTADFLSGLVHFLCDTLGSPRTPIVGQKFIKAFREHHDDPTAMTEGDFVEVNADNFLVCLPVLVPAAHLLDVDEHPLVALYLAVLMAFVVVTNELHKRAHLPAARGLLGRAQRVGLLLSPAHHAVHHRAPHDEHYCITAGVLNPVLARLRFWAAVRRLCGVDPPRGAVG